MKKDIGIPGLMAVVAALYLLGQIASCHETTKSTEATITTDGRVTPANNVDSIYTIIGQIKFELTKMDSMTKELEEQNKQIDSLLNSM